MDLINKHISNCYLYLNRRYIQYIQYIHTYTHGIYTHACTDPHTDTYTDTHNFAKKYLPYIHIMFFFKVHVFHLIY